MQYNSKYEVIIFDFDNTLCNLNLFLLKVTPSDINEINKTIKINNKVIYLNKIFNDYHELFNIFNILKRQNVKLCIASFGLFNIINKIINIVFPNIFDYILTSDNIDSELQKKIPKVFRHLLDLKCPLLYGKNLMIKTIMKKFNVTEPHKVLFFDDDFNNSDCSAKFLKINSYNNTNKGITADLLKLVIFNNKQTGGITRRKIFYLKF